MNKSTKAGTIEAPPRVSRIEVVPHREDDQSLSGFWQIEVKRNSKPDIVHGPYPSLAEARSYAHWAAWDHQCPLVDRSYAYLKTA